MFKVNNKDTKKNIFHTFVLVFLLLTLNMQLLAGSIVNFKHVITGWDRQNITCNSLMSVFPSNRNQSVNLYCLSTDWFLYE